MKLAELQSLFQSAVLTGDAEDGAILDVVAPPRDADRATMMGVYVNAYRLRLAEFLDEDYPALRVLLGDDDFEALVEAYIDANPSRLRNARWYTARLPEFMQESENWSANALAIGLALFERALTDAYDAADAPALSIETLAEFSPQDWPRLGFTFHPSLRLIEVAAGVLDAYAAATADEQRRRRGPPRRTKARSRIARRTRARAKPSPFGARISTPPIASSIRTNISRCYEAMAGQSFGDICQLVAFQNEGQSATERLARFLVTWFSEGLVIGVAEAK